MTPVPAGNESGTTDLRLLADLADGDKAAFHTLYRRYTPRLRGMVFRLLGGHHADTEDALQETWIRGVMGLAKYRGDAQFITWLSGIAVRVCWEIIRRRRPWVTISLVEEPWMEPPDLVERMDLAQALDRLGDAHRVVVVLHDVEGYTHDEIAAWLGVAAGDIEVAPLPRAARSAIDAGILREDTQVNELPLDATLTPEQLAALADMRSDMEGGDLTEMRTAHALEARGLLRATGRRRSARRLTIVASVAAGITLFASGMLFGKEIARKEFAAASPSVQVQRAGSAYVQAVSRLSSISDSVATPVVLAGLQAGTATLRAAVNNLSQRNPDDGTIEGLRDKLDAAALILAHDIKPANDRKVVWF